MALSQKNQGGGTTSRSKNTGSDKNITTNRGLLDRMMPKQASVSSGTRRGGIAGLFSRFSGLVDWFRSITSELRKVTWPTRDTVRNLTIIVIAVSTAVGALLGALDYLFKLLFEQLLR